VERKSCGCDFLVHLHSLRLISFVLSSNTPFHFSPLTRFCSHGAVTLIKSRVGAGNSLCVIDVSRNKACCETAGVIRSPSGRSFSTIALCSCSEGNTKFIQCRKPGKICEIHNVTLAMETVQFSTGLVSCSKHKEAMWLYPTLLGLTKHPPACFAWSANAQSGSTIVLHFPGCCHRKYWILTPTPGVFCCS